MPSWQSTSRIGCPIDNPARRSRGAAPSTRPQWTRVPLDFRPRWRYVVNKAGAANAAPALKYKFYFTPHFCGYTEFGIVPNLQSKFYFTRAIARQLTTVTNTFADKEKGAVKAAPRYSVYVFPAGKATVFRQFTLRCS